eukprot:jgi/Tetstr1/437331/TSEL_002815.t1
MMTRDSEDTGVRVVWDSSTHSTADKPRIDQLEWQEDIASAKEQGNKAMQKGDAGTAVACYTEALNGLPKDGASAQEAAAVLLSNRAAAHLALQDYTQAQSDAECASSLLRTWSKPHHRLAQALLGQGLYADAVAAARQGEQLCRKGLSEGTETGRNPGASLTAGAGLEVALPGRLSFRCINEAMEAAVDGDRILLLRGIHNGQAETVKVTKRVLITGEGELEEATVDFRGNSPAFHITANAVLENVFVDMSGYSAAISINGAENVQPLIENCKVLCSGSDAINVSRKACPILRGCEITGERPLP